MHLAVNGGLGQEQYVPAGKIHLSIVGVISGYLLAGQAPVVLIEVIERHTEYCQGLNRFCSKARQEFLEPEQFDRFPEGPPFT